jgi:hypothetical protein
VQIITILLLLIVLGGLAYLILRLRREDEEHTKTVESLNQRVESLSVTVEKLRKLPVKGIEAGEWVDQLASIESALKEPSDQLKQVNKILEEQDETYRANFQVLADLSQEHFRRVNTLIEEQLADNKKALEKEHERLKKMGEELPKSFRADLVSTGEKLESSLKSVQEKMDAALKPMQEKLDEVIESMVHRIDEKFASEGEARAVMHMQTHDSVNEIKERIDEWQNDLRNHFQEDIQPLAASLEKLGDTQKTLRADLSGHQEGAFTQLTEQWEENKKRSDEIFTRIENHLQELIAEIAARHTAQMSLIADEFDMEEDRYQDLLSRRPQGRTREEEEALFEQLVGLHKKTADRFSRHYYQHLIFMLPHMRKEAFDYYFTRIRKNLPLEVERCTFEQLTSRFQQIEETIMEYAISDEEGLAEEVAGRWKEIVEGVQGSWALKIEEAIQREDLSPDQHLDHLRQIPRHWLDAGAKEKLIEKIKSLSRQIKSHVPAEEPVEGETLPPISPGTSRKTVPLEDNG